MTSPAEPDNSRRAALGRIAKLVLFKAEHHTATIFALMVRAASVLAAFAVTFLLGNRFGPEATGQYALISQTAIFFSVVGLIGLDISAVRHFAKAMADRLPITLASLMKVLAAGAAMLGVVVLVLVLGGETLWRWLFGDVVPRELLWVLCALLIGRAGGQLLAGLLRSQGRTTLSQAFAALVVPAATAIALAIGLANDVSEALWAGAVAGLASIVIGIAVMLRHVSTGSADGNDVVDIPLKPVLQSSLPLWGVSIAMNLNQWYILYVAAQLFTAADIGLIRVAVQIASVLQIIGTTIFSTYSASVSAAFHANNPVGAARLARSAIRVSLAASLPLAILILVAGEFLLGLIGPEFVAAMPLLLIMTVGNLAFLIFGPAGLVLAMSGKERANLAITLSGTALLLVSLPIAGYFGGLKGMTACMVIVSILRYSATNLMVRRLLKINIWTGTSTSGRAGDAS